MAAMKKSTWVWLITFCLAIFWLVLSPPSVDTSELDDNVVCESLAWGLGARDLDKTSIDAAQTWDESLGGSSGEEGRQAMLASFEESVRTSCQDARQARLTTVIVMFGGTLLGVCLYTTWIARTALARTRPEDSTAPRQEEGRAELQ